MEATYWKWPAILTTALVASTVAFAAVAETCYEDLLIRHPTLLCGSGPLPCTRVASFSGMVNGKPSYLSGCLGEYCPNAEGCDFACDIRPFVYWTGVEWELMHYEPGTPHHQEPFCWNAADTATPPRTGWTGILAPAPTFSGGARCPRILPNITILPTGDAGIGLFLDRGLDLPKGETPPLIGLLPLSAVYTIGEIVTGGCQILDADDERLLLSWIHVYAYSVDLAARLDALVLLDHWMADYNWETCEYLIEWDTSGLAPGYCDLVLSFEDSTRETIRIELAPPTE